MLLAGYVITGASSGIARGVALRYGADVVLAARRTAMLDEIAQRGRP